MGIYARVNGEWKSVDAGCGDTGAPGAAVIDSAVADDPLYPVKTSSFEEGGQAYDVYEFLGSGTLNVTTPGFVDALVVGGGGGSGYFRTGGGGAGGLQKMFDIYLSKDDQTITVGAGGSKGISVAPNTGEPGNPSAVSNIYIALGGGQPGKDNSAGPTVQGGGFPGGSGGGAASSSVATFGGSALLGQGNNGGGTDTQRQAGGGGGGAGTAGSNGSGARAGNGGDGEDVSAFIGQPAATLLLAGGGGGGANTTGGAGGVGGGGDGAAAGGGTEGEANTGGGAGGAGITNGSGRNGGSGIVIVRVKVDDKSFTTRTNATTPKTAHAARVENGVVRQVITIPHLNDDDNKITEYCNKIGLPGTWVDTSYTGARRGKYAGVGDLFDLNTRNAEFVSPVETSE